jgi:DNA-binding response OmpR family regulator
MTAIRSSAKISPVSRQADPGTRRRPRQVLSLSPAAEDAADLQKILDGMQWRIAALPSYQKAIGFLKRKRVAAVVCEQTLVDGNWKDILQLLAAFPTHPLLIVTSRLADDSLWSEVLNLGGYNVLAKPFDAKEVRHVFDSVWHETIRSIPRTHLAGVA